MRLPITQNFNKLDNNRRKILYFAFSGRTYGSICNIIVDTGFPIN